MRDRPDLVTKLFPGSDPIGQTVRVKNIPVSRHRRVLQGANMVGPNSNIIVMPYLSGAPPATGIGVQQRRGADGVGPEQGAVEEGGGRDDAHAAEGPHGVARASRRTSRIAGDAAEIANAFGVPYAGR